MTFASDYRAKLWPHGEFASWRIRRANNISVNPKAQVHPVGDANESAFSGFINSDEKSQDPPPTSKPKRCIRIPPSMRRKILSSGKLLEEHFGKAHLSFLTLTMPYTAEEHVELFLGGWSEIQRRFIQELERQLVRSGLPPLTVWVCEEQEKRGWAVGHPCPHLHILFPGRKIGHDWACTPEWCAATWRRVITAVTGIDYSTNAATRIEPVRKNAAGYLAKYMSKGSQAGVKRYLGTRWEPLLPPRWARLSGKLLRMVKQAVQFLTSEGAWWFNRDLGQLFDNGLLRITYSEYGAQSGYIPDLDLFLLEWDYYRELDGVGRSSPIEAGYLAGASPL